MAGGVVLAIDQGTTNTKALLVGRGGLPVFRASVPVDLLQPHSNLIEQAPSDLWQSVRAVIKQCASFAKDVGLAVEGIAISSQRETAVAWRAGRDVAAIGNAISWQCRRSAEVCDRLAPHHLLIRQVTGLPVDPLATAGKWTWLLEHSSEVRSAAESGQLRFGNVDAWLLANFTGGESHATDHSNASRTALFDLRSLKWSEELLSIFGISRAALPEVKSSASQFGTCTTIPELDGVPVVAMIGDSHAALFGHGSYVPGAVKATYGTGSSLMMLTPALLEESASLARTIAWSYGDRVQFAMEGNITMTGSAVQWVGEFLGLTNPIADTVALANSVPDSDGIVFVPAMVGLGAPYWDANARGTISNLGRSHTAAHLARAALDSIAFQIADVFLAMEKATSVAMPTLRADGGATRNSDLMQFQSDILCRPVLRSSNEELSGLGAAWLGGLTLGWWNSLDEIEYIPHPSERFEPSMPAAKRELLYSKWQLAVDRARLQGAPA
jgi:glycerol kinase